MISMLVLCLVIEQGVSENRRVTRGNIQVIDEAGSDEKQEEVQGGT